eukprot:CAMPEP_0114512062 /NCGR_PEP_ID=MMETSP0109-20121206/14756_1 /TAXON_ID=29199 /ORGANISM="Chlorarachnion reptans, Strain CCCM449" /LENGTH=412 /DNA_ID=CAMNT_0001691683 /DNA_START=178 /DNA_END=1416 /DNA_ORIENTATION=-
MARGVNVDPDYHRDLPTEPHHSMNQPMDQSRVYWFWGGSAVVAKRSVRLTPATAERRGFLWNDYPLETANWEVEFDFKAHSKPHFGGDGFGFWILDSTNDPILKKEPDSLTGPLFGMKEDFQGVGLIFDTYDNDGDRKNPSIFTLENRDGKKFIGNHDNDYMNDMYKKTPESAKDPQFTCQLDYRNTKQPVRILVRFLHKIMHVYVDSGDDQGWRVCLAVEFEKDFFNHHIAFTAITGQVADVHEITSVSTRYLEESEKDFDDFLLQHAENNSKRSSWGQLLWIVCMLVGLGLNVLTGMEIYKYLDYSSSGINSTLIADNLKIFAWPHTILHFTMTGILLLLGAWFGFVLNLPIVAYKVWAIQKNKLLLDANSVGAEAKIHSSNILSYPNRMYVMMGFYAVSQIYILMRLSS